LDKLSVKKLIIILLALVNIFLLVLVISITKQEADSERLRSKALLDILANHGISLEDGTPLPAKCPDIIILERSLKKERSMLSSLIGSCSYENQGGNIYIFGGHDAVGQASIRGTGDFKIALDTSVVPVETDHLAAAETTLKKLGIKYNKKSLKLGKEDGLVRVTATCTYRKHDILNAKINLYFSDSQLLFLTGRRPPDIKTDSVDVNNDLDGIAIVMNFLEYIRRSGQVCNTIQGITTEYFIDSATIGDCTLTPVWCIETDAGTFYFDGVTGKARSLEK
jgi:hypothetical protein